MHRHLTLAVAAVLALVVAGTAGSAKAQSQAEFKRQLKAEQVLYKEPGLMEVTVQSMRGMMMLTGNVATDDQSKKAEEIIKGMRGVKEVRNRIRVGKVDDCSGAKDADLMAKVDKEIENDEELAQARRKLDISVKDRNISLKGELKDYSQAGSLVNMVKRVPCFNSLNFDGLEY
ncbi:MAG TPA: BON domain-containing protein [Myxococcota bacterium]|nr:BON domain-containing protein [Myxococcota bacterium]